MDLRHKHESFADPDLQIFATMSRCHRVMIAKHSSSTARRGIAPGQLLMYQAKFSVSRLLVAIRALHNLGKWLEPVICARSLRSALVTDAIPQPAWMISNFQMQISIQIPHSSMFFLSKRSCRFNLLPLPSGRGSRRRSCNPSVSAGRNARQTPFASLHRSPLHACNHAQPRSKPGTFVIDALGDAFTPLIVSAVAAAVARLFDGFDDLPLGSLRVHLPPSHLPPTVADEPRTLLIK
jgi:hypothetical protein